MGPVTIQTLTVLFYTVVCLGVNIAKDTSKLDKLIRWAGSVASMKLDSLTVAEERTPVKLLDIMDNANNSLHSH